MKGSLPCEHGRRQNREHLKRRDLWALLRVKADFCVEAAHRACACACERRGRAQGRGNAGGRRGAGMARRLIRSGFRSCST
eukprot:354861-Chlamydomonas_euryale.AAC.17